MNKGAGSKLLNKLRGNKRSTKDLGKRQLAEKQKAEKVATEENIKKAKEIMEMRNKMSEEKKKTEERKAYRDAVEKVRAGKITITKKKETSTFKPPVPSSLSLKRMREEEGTLKPGPKPKYRREEPRPQSGPCVNNSDFPVPQTRGYPYCGIPHSAEPSTMPTLPSDDASVLERLQNLVNEDKFEANGLFVHASRCEMPRNRCMKPDCDLTRRNLLKFTAYKKRMLMCSGPGCVQIAPKWALYEEIEFILSYHHIVCYKDDCTLPMCCETRKSNNTRAPLIDKHCELEQLRGNIEERIQQFNEKQQEDAKWESYLQEFHRKTLEYSLWNNQPVRYQQALVRNRIERQK
jgi:hypothetical protein